MASSFNLTPDELEALYDSFGIGERFEWEPVHVRPLRETFVSISERLKRDGHALFVQRTMDMARDAANGLLTEKVMNGLLVRYRVFMLDQGYPLEIVALYDRAQL